MSAAVLIIANPSAGYRRPAWRTPVTEVLSSLGPVEFVTPGSAAETTAAARDAEQRGVPLIVAAGGDGTVHRVVNGLSSTSSHLGVLPVGTANDLSMFLGQSRSPVEVARAMLSGVFQDIDAIRINRVRVMTVGGFAVVAEAALEGDRLKRRWPWMGALAYTAAAVHVIAARGGDPVAGSLVANQATFGRHLRLPCDSVNNDGVCEVATFAGGRRWRLVRALMAMSFRVPMPTDAVACTTVSRTTLMFDNEVAAFGDGEDLGRGREFQIWVEASAVRVRCARAAASEGMLAVQAASVNVMAISSATE